MSELISLATDWLPKLVRAWDRIRRDRHDELERIFNEFDNWEDLAEKYIEPNCQPTNPTDDDEDEPSATWVTQVPVRKRINEFLSGEFKKRDGRNTLFVLSDAGMGKSSMLIMLKISHLLRFWPSHVTFHLLKLGEDTLEQLTEVQDCRNAVLLLDALDEDPLAWGRIEERIAELLGETQRFRQAIITCRTQFFPRGGKLPIEQMGKVAMCGYACQLLYLSFFSDEQVETYLNRVYPSSKWRQWFGAQNKKLTSARDVVLSMNSLRMRPLLLGYVEDLVDAGLNQWDDYVVYRALVHRWLMREEKKPGQKATREQLLEACEALAYYLHISGVRSLGFDALKDLRRDVPGLQSLETFDFGGRSLLNLNSEREYRFAHYSIQEFLVVHRILESEKRPGSRIRMTDQMFSFGTSWMSRASSVAPEVWESFEWPRPDLADLSGPWREEERRILAGTDCESLAELVEDRDERNDILCRLGEKAQNPFIALYLVSAVAQTTRNGDDLYHLDLACEVLAMRHHAMASPIRATQQRLYDHIPPPPERLFEKVATKECVVDLWREVPVGTYRLGSPKEEHAWEGDRLPYSATLESPLRLAVVPVTQAQYRAFDPDHRSHFQSDLRPVECVSWYAATAFCRWLARQDGTVGARLPTEEEWEIACRAGTTTQYWSGNSEEDLGRVGWYRGNSKEKTHEVGEKAKNTWGLYDVHGNVWEWTQSPWSNPQAGKQDDVIISSETAAGSQLLPHAATPDDASADLAEARRAHRVFRGGGCWVSAGRARSAFRSGERSGGAGAGTWVSACCCLPPGPPVWPRPVLARLLIYRS